MRLFTMFPASCRLELLFQIPFRNFVRTNHGELSDIQLNMSPMLRSIGISLLGGNAGIAGRYELNVDTFRIVNEEDAVSDLGMFLYFSYMNDRSDSFI